MASRAQTERQITIPMEANKNSGSENIYYSPELK
jgi:hypothetical protein